MTGGLMTGGLVTAPPSAHCALRLSLVTFTARQIQSNYYRQFQQFHRGFLPTLYQLSPLIINSRIALCSGNVKNYASFNLNRLKILDRAAFPPESTKLGSGEVIQD